MKRRRTAQLLLHGIVLILIGSLAGFVYTAVLTGDVASGAQAWRFAHLNGLVNGAIVVAISGAGSYVALSEAGQRWLLLIVGGSYANVVASVLGATLGERGLSPLGSPTNALVFGLFAVVVATLLPGLVLVLVGAWRAIESEPSRA